MAQGHSTGHPDDKIASKTENNVDDHLVEALSGETDSAVTELFVIVRNAPRVNVGVIWSQHEVTEHDVRYERVEKDSHKRVDQT